MKPLAPITRGKHRAESRDGGGELQQTSAPLLEHHSSIQEVFETVEALYLGTLEGEAKARANELVKNDPDAKAYFEQLESSTLDDDEFDDLHAELGRRLPWLLTPPPVQNSAMAQAMASLYGPPVANFDPAESLRQQKKAALGRTTAATPKPQAAVAATLEQIQLPPRPTPTEGRKG